MATALDVAAYITATHGVQGKVRLQKLCYLAQGWHLAWQGRPLFDDPLEAWVHGPVSKAVWRSTTYGEGNGEPASLSPREKEVIDSVADFYKHFSVDDLVEYSHNDAWRAARGDLGPKDRGNQTLSNTDIYRSFAKRVLLGCEAPKKPRVIKRLDGRSFAESMVRVDEEHREILNLLATV
ncbi:Panacea domain-containing protein [Corynebacterium uterequi]|uniref:Putative phage-associated protein n=1 Tax=Corynebacterium uterequi TaxID=1072256 RepID=A0A0G3HGW5_9CORY|nr:Panacea domain-containing protein [Corynebacterium uterequi]AKK11133.1 putative phage-associated protein [Corynebacterium uterequi]